MHDKQTLEEEHVAHGGMQSTQLPEPSSKVPEGQESQLLDDPTHVAHALLHSEVKRVKYKDRT